MNAEVALLGTGIAPLVAANRLLAEGRTSIVINPDWDFFSEDSELPFDPLLPASSRVLSANRIQASLAGRVVDGLRPDFPGAIESWPTKGGGPEGYHDPAAPHVRERARLWIRPLDHRNRTLRSRDWEAVEDLYVEAADADLNPQILNGIVALKRFPGLSSRIPAGEQARAMLLPRLGDVDVSRYRNGLLEYIRERLGAERVICGASQIELFPEGVRFYAGHQPRTERVQELIVFWTPRLTQWVYAQAKRSEVVPPEPEGIRLWEEWSLVSSEGLDPGVIGMFEDMAVWAEVEGPPSADTRFNWLNVLRAGPLVPPGSLERSWATQDSFGALFRLTHEFLRWEQFSVRALKTRAVFEWPGASSWPLGHGGGVQAQVICGCDGPLSEVVRVARHSCEGRR